jgi:hypothetical protein
MKCGAGNPDSVNYCESCGAALPKMPQTSTAPPPQVNERYNQLREAGEKAVSGEWTSEEFITFLNGISSILAQKEREIKEILETEIPQEAYSDFEDELNVGFSGIDYYNQGIAEMLCFGQDGDPVHIDAGLNMIKDGNELINEAMRINRENRRKLEEMYIDTSTFL